MPEVGPHGRYVPPIKNYTQGSKGNVDTATGPRGRYYTPPPHDGRARPSYGLTRGALPVGGIYQAPGVLPGKQYAIPFLYNPTQLEEDYSMYNGIYPQNVQNQGNTTPAALTTPGMMTITWDLILDRTYEVWGDRSHPGVSADVRVLQKLLQYSEKVPFMQMVPVWVVFGNYSNPNCLRYYGWLQSMSVIYTNWTQWMVPYRAALSGLTLQIMSTTVANNSSVAAARKAENNDTGTVSLVTNTPGVKGLDGRLVSPTGRRKLRCVA